MTFSPRARAQGMSAEPETAAVSSYHAGDPAKEKQLRGLWKWSLVAIVAGTAFDAASSVNGVEANPMLRSGNGRFGYRGLLVKSAAASATFAFEFHLTRNRHIYKPLAIFNFVQAGVFAGAGAYNSTVSSH